MGTTRFNQTRMFPPPPFPHLEIPPFRLRGETIVIGLALISQRLVPCCMDIHVYVHMPTHMYACMYTHIYGAKRCDVECYILYHMYVYMFMYALCICIIICYWLLSIKHHIL